MLKKNPTILVYDDKAHRLMNKNQDTSLFKEKMSLCKNFIQKKSVPDSSMVPEYLRICSLGNQSTKFNGSLSEWILQKDLTKIFKPKYQPKVLLEYIEKNF